MHFLADLTHLHPEQLPVLLHLQQDMISLKLSRGFYSLKNQAVSICTLSAAAMFSRDVQRL